MAQCPEIVVRIRLDEQQVEDLLAQLRQIFEVRREPVDRAALDEALKLTADATVRQVRRLVAQGRL